VKRVAKVSASSVAIAGTGYGFRLEPGMYEVAELDGTAERGEVYVFGPHGGALVRVNPDDPNVEIVEVGA
jgi:hypothetical protein